MPYRELDTVRLKAAQDGPGNYSLGEVHAVPAGAVGTVVSVFADGAVEVEFTIREPELHDGQLVRPGSFHVITLTPAQIAPA
jgi:hypothetical protein